VEPLVTLVFSGKLIPTVPAEEARQNLAKLLKLEPTKVEALFSGQRTVLKRNLTPADAVRYITHLAGLGILVDTEPQTPSPVAVPPVAVTGVPAAATTPTTPASVVNANPANVPAPPTTKGLSLAPVVEEVTCPKCGERQPKRTLCLVCATDMPRYAAAQEELQREQRQEKLVAATSARGGGAVKDDRADPPALFGWGIEGRIGRLSSLLGGSLLFIALIWIIALALKSSSLSIVFLLFLLPFVVFSIRLGILRCHDIGWTGWLMLLAPIPYLGALFSFLLLVLPGNKQDNYGEAPRSASGFATLAAMAATAISIAVASGIIGSEVKSLAENGFGRSANNVPADPPRRYASTNDVTMYSLTTCGYCVQKRRELEEEGIPFREVFLDQDTNAGDDMRRKLAAQDLPAGTVGTPTLEVNGAMLPNNPDMAEIRRHLR